MVLAQRRLQPPLSSSKKRERRRFFQTWGHHFFLPFLSLHSIFFFTIFITIFSDGHNSQQLFYITYIHTTLGIQNKLLCISNAILFQYLIHAPSLSVYFFCLPSRFADGIQPQGNVKKRRSERYYSNLDITNLDIVNFAIQ